MTLLKRAQVEHLDAILRLGLESNEAPHWNRNIYEEIVQATGAEAASDKPGLRRLLIVAQAEETGPVSGFAVAAASSDEAELESVVVAADQRRKRIGKLLCLALMDWARGQGASQMWLEVRASNVAAQSLYRSLGFDQVGLRRGYYSAPLEDAVQMTVELGVVDL